MKNKCFDEGIIQAYVDGELEPNRSESVIRHVASCQNCALFLEKAEEENAIVFSALEEELGAFVPTERLREKVFASINEIQAREQRSVLQKLSDGFAYFDISLRNPSMAALCCTLLFVGSFVIAMNFYPRLPGLDEVALGDDGLIIVDGDVDPRRASSGNNAAQEVDSKPRPTMIAKVNRPAKRRRTRRSFKPINASFTPTKPVPVIAGEESYEQTIASLRDTIDSNKNGLFASGERIAFEKDIAITDDAISKLRAAVRKNPNDIAAKTLLKITYQNKIDLLNSVSEKNELMASMQ